MNQSPTWNTLPIEIRDRILYFYCAEVINEYTQLTADICIAHKSDENIKTDGGGLGGAVHFMKDGGWTNHVDCLPKFAEVLRFSRYFYQTISEFIKIDTKSVLETLRKLHQDRATAVFILAEVVEMNDGKKKLSLDFIPKLAGNFMKNVSAFEQPPFHYIFFSRRVAVLTIPRIEEWVLQQVEATRNNHKWPITLEHCEDEADGNMALYAEFDFKPGEFEVEGNYLFRFDVTSIARPARLSDCFRFPNCPRCNARDNSSCVNPPPDLLMVREILSSKPGSTWWLFTRMRERFMDTQTRWFLVNWKEKKMFKSPDMTTGIIWDDSWDETNWRRYRDDPEL